MPRKPRSFVIILATGGFVLTWLRLRRRRPQEPPQRFKHAIERLATTFIKLAQGLSLRMDLLPRAYRDALAEPQSRVAPFPSHWLQQAQADDGRPPIAIHHRGLDRLESRLERVGNRMVLALLALGLYVGGAVLMLHSAGPWLYGVPIAAVFAFLAAAGLTLKLVAAVFRSEGL